MFWFSLRGFRDALTMQYIGEEQINSIQNFIRNQLPGILSKWKGCEEKLPINEEDFFGEIYVYDPASFEFSEGDKIQIAEIVTYIKKVIAIDSKFFSATESDATCIHTIEAQPDTTTAKHVMKFEN